MSETETARAALAYADNRMSNVAAATVQNHLGTYGAGLVREMLAKAFVAGVEHDANHRRAAYVGDVDAKPRAMVRAGAGFLSDPSSALVLRGRLVVAPSVGRPASMLVTVDARRGMDVVEVGIEARELSRMLNDLYTLVVWGVPDERK